MTPSSPRPTPGRYSQALHQSMTLWHGSGSEKPITAFRPGTWLAEDKYFADGYSSNFGYGLTEEVTVDPKKPFRISSDNVADVLTKAGYPEETVERAQGQGLGYGLGNLIHNETPLLLQWARSQGIDLLVFRDADITNQLYFDGYLLVDPNIVTKTTTHKAELT